jgi:hypothetical protein
MTLELNSEELHDLYFSPNIFRIITSRTPCRWIMQCVSRDNKIMQTEFQSVKKLKERKRSPGGSNMGRKIIRRRISKVIWCEDED